MVEDIEKDWYVDNLIHNRIDTRWFPSDNWTAAVEFRNRIFYGASVQLFPDYAKYIEQDNGYWDLSWNIATGDSYVFNTTLDRVWIDYTSGDFQARLGRQRINWGQNLVWNPNDVFNAYSFFDFDYEERPGTDALRMQYYTSFTSQAEFVYQVGDSIEDMSFAGNYRFNKWNYDIQFLGGYVKNDAVFGTGWSGDIKGGGFRGEFTYFHSLYDSAATKGQLVGSISGDYTFRNSLFLHLAAIYNSAGSTGNIVIDESFLLLKSVSAKNLTFSRTELLGQVSYQVSPLIKGDLASIVNPYDGSFFFGPSGTFSLQDNLEFMFTAQFFFGDDGTLYGDYPHFLYWRLKWAF
ncbi:hypothetical protein ACFLU5_05105 [Bacteroidota bacterium]